MRYVGIRIVQTVFLLWFILTFLFFFFRLMPGDYTDLMLAQGASPESVAAFEERWGLNDPLYVQYANYLVNFVQLDVGHSMVHNEPVWDFVKMKIFNSLILVGPGITIAYILGSIFGSVLGSKRDSVLERVGITGMITTSAFPSFFIGIIFILIFASWFNLFPTSGMLSPQVASQYSDAAWWRPYLTLDFAKHFVLPFSVIALRGMAGPGMVMRTSVVEVMDQDFTYYHRINGVPYRKRLRHIGKHAILPVVTLYPVSMVRAVSGLVVLEIVFNWPGIGYTLVNSVFARDLPVVQFIFFIAAALVVIGNFGVDILYGIIDPRVSITD